MQPSSVLDRRRGCADATDRQSHLEASVTQYEREKEYADEPEKHGKDFLVMKTAMQRLPDDTHRTALAFIRELRSVGMFVSMRIRRRLRRVTVWYEAVERSARYEGQQDDESTCTGCP